MSKRGAELIFEGLGRCLDLYHNVYISCKVSCWVELDGQSSINAGQLGGPQGTVRLALAEVGPRCHIPQFGDRLVVCVCCWFRTDHPAMCAQPIWTGLIMLIMQVLLH